jgi:hypothetical protein
MQTIIFIFASYYFFEISGINKLTIIDIFQRMLIWINKKNPRGGIKKTGSKQKKIFFFPNFPEFYFNCQKKKFKLLLLAYYIR